MIVDDRTGSGDLLPLLRARGLPAELGRLPYGDISFTGNGPEGCPIGIGVEVKTIHDVLSCITNGRFAGHQLPGLKSSYAFSWLLVEGRYRADRNTGVLQYYSHRGDWRQATVGNRAFMFKDLSYWLLTMEMRGGIKVAYSSDRQGTAQTVADMFHWWNDKEWEEHRSHLAFDESTSGSPLLIEPGLVRRVAKELPGIGWDKSGKVAAKFQSVIDLCDATVEQWQDIPGIGYVLSRRVYWAIRGEKP